MVIPVRGHNFLTMFVHAWYFPFGYFGLEGDDPLLRPDRECLHVLAPFDEAALLLAGRSFDGRELAHTDVPHCHLVLIFLKECDCFSVRVPI